MVSEHSMPMQDLLVIGLGYVGLPLAVEAARAGFRVTGYDTGAGITDGLMAGRSHVGDVSDADVADLLGSGFWVTADEARLGPQDVIVICVPTPLSPDAGPDLSAVRAARRLRGGCCARARWSRWRARPTPALPRRRSARSWRRSPG